MKPAVILGIISFIVSPLLSQSISLNEAMSVNLSTAQDEDGDFEDWVEIYNGSSTAIDLNGYGLSDRLQEPHLWEFPPLTLSPGDYMLVFASGKDRRQAARHWETIIDWGDSWRYRIGSSEPPSDWRERNFDDGAWLEGATGIGYGDDDDNTIISATLSFHIRYTFTIEDIDAVRAAIFHVDYDDAYVAYLNGVEFSRANIGQAGDPPPAYDDLPHFYTEPLIAGGGQPLTVAVPDFSELLQSGDNVLAIQVHNYLLTSSDMTMIPFLTLGFDTAPANARGLSPTLAGLVPELHTNFSVTSAGETLYLSDPAGTIADSLEIPALSADLSYGRQPDGAPTLAIFDTPTPGAENAANGYSGIAPPPDFSEPGGFYSNALALGLTATQQNAEIRYTLDGSIPDSSAPLYDAPIDINSTTVIRARTFLGTALPSNISTATFLVGEDIDITTVSLVTEPDNFWDQDSGIYATGLNAGPNFPFFGANFWEDWERPIHMEIFEADGSPALAMDAGVKIFGGWSRGHAQKSLSIFARGEYGSNEIPYRIFAGKDIDSFQSIVLRNSGNDWTSTMFRDALLQDLVREIDIDGQAYRPAIVFINGEFWGIQNFREKLNEHYIAGNYNIDPQQIDMLEFNGQVIHGSSTHYDDLLAYITANDLADSVHFQHVTQQLDLNNFLDYQVSQIYFDNTDWPGNNIKFWRPQTEDGKWRWMMFDTDFGFGLWGISFYANNTLAFALDPNGPAWPNPPWSTFLLRQLMKNEDFQIGFINRFADRINVQFHRDQVTAAVDSIQALLDNDIERHLNRWGTGTKADWNSRVQNLRTFGTLRPARVRNHIIDYFGLAGQVTIDLDVAGEGGFIKLNSIHHRSFPWAGIYFQDVPISLHAIPEPGYRFVRWEGDLNNTVPSQSVVPSGSLALTAVFERTPHSGQVVINEINYNSAPNFDPEDWIELFNDTGAPLNLANWQFKDQDDTHLFAIPNGTEVPLDGFLVLVRDSSLFTAAFPDVTNFIGNLDFGLDGAGELLRLYDSNGSLVDSLTYGDSAPWPAAPDGNGPTLALRDPASDNSLAENWHVSCGYGSPGAPNDIRVSINEQESEAAPKAFHLYQNMPNPFNPATVFRFELAQAGKVQLTVYSILGQEVEVIVNRSMDAGHHTITWAPGGTVSSGIYIYRLQTDSGFSDSRKNDLYEMTVIKVRSPGKGNQATALLIMRGDWRHEEVLNFQYRFSRYLSTSYSITMPTFRKSENHNGQVVNKQMLEI